MMEDRRRLSQYILILTGHNFWRRHTHLVETEKARKGLIPWEEVTPPYCDRCLEVMPTGNSADLDDFLQTSWHFYASCEALAPLRLEMFGEAYYKPLEEIDRKVILEFARRGSLHILPENNDEVMNIDMEVSNNGSDVLNNSIL